MAVSASPLSSPEVAEGRSTSVPPHKIPTRDGAVITGDHVGAAVLKEEYKHREAVPRIPCRGHFWNVLTRFRRCVYGSSPMATLQSGLHAYHYLASAQDKERVRGVFLLP